MCDRHEGCVSKQLACHPPPGPPPGQHPGPPRAAPGPPRVAAAAAARHVLAAPRGHFDKSPELVTRQIVRLRG